MSGKGGYLGGACLAGASSVGEIPGDGGQLARGIW